MGNFVRESVYLGVVLTLVIYEVSVWLRKKSGLAILNPLLLSILVLIAGLKLLKLDYEVYAEGAKYISYLLTPATVALALPLYEHIEQLKCHWKAILLGIFSGTLTSTGTILALSVVFRLEHRQYVTLLPKSITTAIGMGVSEELGGIVSITVAVIVVTGILGNMIAEPVCRLFCVKHPVAKGVAIGTASHAIGTAKALELGELEGAMSSLSIAVSGLLTVVLAPIFAGLY